MIRDLRIAVIGAGVMGEAMIGGMEAFAALMDEGEAARLDALTRHMDAAHERVMDRPHWYLPFLAVTPDRQGQGSGTLLMRHTLDRASAAGAPCYLDSADERNLPFYERLGFRTVEAGTEPGSQLRTWALRRGRVGASCECDLREQ